MNTKSKEVFGVRLTDPRAKAVKVEFESTPRTVSWNEFVVMCISKHGPKILRRKNSVVNPQPGQAI